MDVTFEVSGLLANVISEIKTIGEIESVVLIQAVWGFVAQGS